MKTIIFALLIFINIAFTQDWKEPEAIWNDWSHVTTSEDSIFYRDGFIYICGNDSLHILIPEEHTSGIISYWGKITNTDGQADTVIIKIAPYRGDGSILDSDFAPNYEAFNTVIMTSNGTTTFEGFPMANETINESFSSYFDFLIYGGNNKTRKIYLKVERVIK